MKVSLEYKSNDSSVPGVTNNKTLGPDEMVYITIDAPNGKGLNGTFKTSISAYGVDTATYSYYCEQF